MILPVTRPRAASKDLHAEGVEADGVEGVAAGAEVEAKGPVGTPGSEPGRTRTRPDTPIMTGKEDVIKSLPVLAGHPEASHTQQTGTEVVIQFVRFRELADVERNTDTKCGASLTRKYSGVKSGIMDKFDSIVDKLHICV